MKLRILMCVALLVSLPAFAGEGHEHGREMSAEEAEMMKKWEEYRTPGDHHKHLEALVGSWSAQVSHWMAPGAPPQESTGSCTYAWVMGGRYLKQEFQSSFQGMPFEGYGLTGYDNFKKKYVGVWTDSMSTTMLWFEGIPVDKTGDIMVSYGPMDEYLTGEHDKTVKYTTKKINKDKFVFEINDLGIGENGKVVIKITYTRPK